MPIVTVDPTGEEIYLPEGQTVLAGLYAAGYSYTIGCRRGGCGVCKIDLLDGGVTYDHPVADEVLSREERQEGVCLTCRAVPDGDVTVRFRTGSLRLVQPLLRSLNEKSRLQAAASAPQPKE
ncbi:2Fe-2S iron-sulfur cluster-binding protein [Nocardioides sp.]|uniref:2Fe-2S iron-sulfur cluster-binding protein n=1 Tax=Nocardioides sp. TaxID=35761 RepID=UPI00378478E3